MTPVLFKFTRIRTLKLAVLLCCLPCLSIAQTGFNHVALCSHDLKASTAFYTTVLQLKTIPNPFKDTVHQWYSVAPNIQMHIIKGDCAAAEHKIADHICFTVSSVPKFIEHLDALKITYTNWKGAANEVEHRVDGVSQVYFRDPDGYWIEVNDAK